MYIHIYLVQYIPRNENIQKQSTSALMWPWKTNESASTYSFTHSLAINGPSQPSYKEQRNTAQIIQHTLSRARPISPRGIVSLTSLHDAKWFGTKGTISLVIWYQGTKSTGGVFQIIVTAARTRNKYLSRSGWRKNHICKLWARHVVRVADPVCIITVGHRPFSVQNAPMAVLFSLLSDKTADRLPIIA